MENDQLKKMFVNIKNENATLRGGITSKHTTLQSSDTNQLGFLFSQLGACGTV